MIKWIKKLFYIVDRYDKDKDTLVSSVLTCQKLIRDAEEEIKKRTAINVDMGRTRSEIIITGFYKNRDYVQVFQMENDCVGDLIERLKEMERYGSVKRVDGAPGLRSIVLENLERF